MNKKVLLIFFLFLIVFGACKPVESNNEVIDSSVYSRPYIANTNTGKFHLDTCRFIPEILEEHKIEYETKEAAIQAGFIACKVCKP